MSPLWVADTSLEQKAASCVTCLQGLCLMDLIISLFGEPCDDFSLGPFLPIQDRTKEPRRVLSFKV